MAIRVTFWHEFRHEKTVEKVKSIYPDGLHAYLKSCLECDDIKITLAALDDPNQGITDELLENTDVLMWWGHMAHHEVNDELVEKVPADGLCGSTDEMNLGFTYRALNEYIRTGVCSDPQVKERIDTKHKANLFKLMPMPVFKYRPPEER